MMNDESTNGRIIIDYEMIWISKKFKFINCFMINFHSCLKIKLQLLYFETHLCLNFIQFFRTFIQRYSYQHMPYQAY